MKSCIGSTIILVLFVVVATAVLRFCATIAMGV